MATPNKGLNIPSRGSFQNQWDVPVNQNWASLDQSMGTILAVPFTSSDVTLTASQLIYAGYACTGTLGANVVLIFPATYAGVFTVRNACTGAFTLSARTSGGATIVIPQGAAAIVYTDGTDMRFADGLAADGQLVYAVDSGSANAYVITTPFPTPLKAGVTVWWKASNANTTASTLTANGGAGAIKSAQGGADPGAGEIVVGGVYASTYDGTVWRTQGLGFLSGGGGTVVGNLTLQSNDAGAAAAPSLTLYRNSSSPDAADAIGEVVFSGEDSAGNTQTYARAFGSIVDPTSTSEDGRFNVETVIAGTSATRGYVQHGLVMGAATGGDMGAGTANLVSLYINGLLRSPFGPTTVRTASASAELDYVLDPTLYSGYLVEMVNILPASNGANPQWLVSTDGGSTFITTGTYYYSVGNLIGTGGSLIGLGVNGTATALDMINDSGSSAGQGISGFIYVSNGAGAGGTTLQGVFSLIGSGGTHSVNVFGGRNSTATQVTALRFKFDSGNITSGSLRFRPLLLT